jgi:hypothetical protein
MYAVCAATKVRRLSIPLKSSRSEDKCSVPSDDAVVSALIGRDGMNLTSSNEYVCVSLQMQCAV